MSYQYNEQVCTRLSMYPVCRSSSVKQLGGPCSSYKYSDTMSECQTAPYVFEHDSAVQRSFAKVSRSLSSTRKYRDAVLVRQAAKHAFGEHSHRRALLSKTISRPTRHLSALKYSFGATDSMAHAQARVLLDFVNQRNALLLLASFFVARSAILAIDIFMRIKLGACIDRGSRYWPSRSV